MARHDPRLFPRTRVSSVVTVAIVVVAAVIAFLIGRTSSPPNRPLAQPSTTAATASSQWTRRPSGPGLTRVAGEGFAVVIPSDWTPTDEGHRAAPGTYQSD